MSDNNTGKCGDLRMKSIEELVLDSGLFDTRFYSETYFAPASSPKTPLALVHHYLGTGWFAGYDPSRAFSTNFYLEENRDVAGSGENPLAHYVCVGRGQGRRALPEGVESTIDLTHPHPHAPLDSAWEAFDGIATERTEATVCVIIPVYAGYHETLRCIFSVLAAKQKVSWRLLVVDDHGPDRLLRRKIYELAARNVFELISTGRNSGFVQAANLGMKLAGRADVVLLNADTEVHNDWLDRLVAAAGCYSNVATVTPLTNNGELASYPHTLQNNWKRLELSDAELDRLVATANAAGNIIVPTGVGFCLYISRSCLDAIGLFNEEKFGLGYGEENDFCFRAVNAGWINLVATDIFVRHYGAVSFGATKKAQRPSAIEAMTSLHPAYAQTIDQYLFRNPIQQHRRRIDCVRILRTQHAHRILFVSGYLEGDIRRHMEDLKTRLALEDVSIIDCRPAQVGQGVCFGVPAVQNVPSLDNVAAHHQPAEFADVLRLLGVDHIHIFSMVGYAPPLFEMIRLGAGMLGISYDVTIHTYESFCPRLYLVDSLGRYCGEPPLAQCEFCVSTLGPSMNGEPVAVYRERYERLLASARTVYAPDHDVAQRLRRRFPRLSFEVRPFPEVQCECDSAEDLSFR